ncbi:MAG: UDP-N-acetylmuramoyl-tripeptide--D-alanyl-D-alanine ligase [Candidatus Pelagadaptatus aseana]|uniref:UDP-N-acetylmuramoyl-tripeptide--D-alanyl-D- alanine ligase n=1 Tax=Candidatus Pelagadaptatus aseana TaxID=3120508 RepID=UPI0039B29F05
MIKALSLSQVAGPMGARVIGDDASFTRVSTDTRTIQSGDLFVALKGENFDGHRFVASAIAQGAVAAVVSNPVEGVEAPQLLVADTTRALGDLGRINREAYTGILLALTGSCGKTTVKEMLSVILQQHSQVAVTRGNLNNHIGAPQTLLAIEPGDEYAVVELGASGMGEIDYLASLAQPQVSLVNNVAAAHLEGFGSEDGVAEEKSKIYRHLRQGGVAVVNGDDRYAPGWLEWLAEDRPDVKVMRFSTSATDSDCYASNVTLESSGGYAFDLTIGDETGRVCLPVMGKQNVANALAAACCAYAAGISLAHIVTGLESVTAVKGRMQARRVSDDLLVIDDSYNANPGSVLAAAQVLMDFDRQGKKVTLVLGNLAELGVRRLEALRKLGQDLRRLGVPSLVVVSDNAAAIAEGFAEGATANQSVRRFANKQQAQNFLKSQLWSESVILIKGSRSAHMEDVVKSLTTNEDN